ncbi:MAG: thioredoxin family protein [Dehalococcoidia bacterium]
MPGRNCTTCPLGTPMKVLRLYVQDGCPSCRAALEVFERIAERSDIDARVIDLGLSCDEKPDAVFAVPTFTLDGQVVSLGTPSWDEITSLLAMPARGADA